MSELYFQTRIPFEWPEDLKKIATDEIRRRIPKGAIVRHEGYLTAFDDMYSIIYLMENP